MFYPAHITLHPKTEDKITYEMRPSIDSSRVQDIGPQAQGVADLLLETINDVLIASQGASLPRSELIFGALCIDALGLSLQATHGVLLLPNLLSQLLLQP